MLTIKEIIQATQATSQCARADRQIEGVSIDSRTIKENEFFVAIKGPRFDGHHFIGEAIKKGCSGVLASSGFLNSAGWNVSRIEVPVLTVEDTTSSLAKLASFYRRHFSIPVIAVTGSNGKTTTKDMIAHVLSKRLRVLKNPETENNIFGVALSLLRIRPGIQAVVLELGTNHCGEIKTLAQMAYPNIGLITNIGPVHLEGFKSLSGVREEKWEIMRNMARPAIGLINADDCLLGNCHSLKKPFILSFGIKRAADIWATEVCCQGRQVSFLLKGRHRIHLGTIGRHNIYNALAAIGVGFLLGVDIASMKKALECFVFPAQRLKREVCRAIEIIDDTYNANPISLSCALEAISEYDKRRRKVFLFGDMRELGKDAVRFHKEIAPKIEKAGVEVVVTLGELAGITGLTLKKSRTARKLQVNLCRDHQEAIAALRALLKPRDILLVKGSRAMALEKVIEGLRQKWAL